MPHNVSVSDETSDETPICSAKGCRAAAVWVLAWNNPKIHTPERRKTGSPVRSTASTCPSSWAYGAS